MLTDIVGELGKEIKELGGGHMGRVGSGVTHLVVVEKEGWGEGAKGECFSCFFGGY